MDPYRVLGVDSKADLPTIRAAYFDLMRRYHPDRTGGDEAAQKRARDINLAFDLLKDAGRRAAYDRTRPARPGAAGRPTPIYRAAPFKPPSGPTLADRSRRLRQVRRFQAALFIGGCLLLAGGAVGLAWVMGPQTPFSAATGHRGVADRISRDTAEVGPIHTVDYVRDGATLTPP